MNNKKDGRELTYNEAKALLNEMYYTKNTEMAKELWKSYNKDNEIENKEATENNQNKRL